MLYRESYLAFVPSSKGRQALVKESKIDHWMALGALFCKAKSEVRLLVTGAASACDGCSFSIENMCFSCLPLTVILACPNHRPPSLSW